MPITEETVNMLLQCNSLPFLCDVYHSNLTTNASRNIFFSPIGTANMISMISSGDEDVTRHLGYPDQDRVKAMRKALVDNVSFSTTIHSNDSELEPPALLAYLKDVHEANVQNEIPKTDNLNTWVKNATGKKITQFEQTLSASTERCIANAIHLELSWNWYVNPQLTRKKSFNLNDNERIMRKFMLIPKDIGRVYFPRANCDIIELPYKGGRTSMVVFLPRETEGLKTIERMLSPSFLQDAWSALDQITLQETTEINVYLPLLQLHGSDTVCLAPDVMDKLDKMDLLEQIGYQEQFRRSYIEICETGTIACEANAVCLGPDLEGSILTEESAARRVCVDHPFLFCILFRPTKTVLFIGSVKEF